MNFEKYSPQLLRDCIDFELKKNSSPVIASRLAKDRLDKDPKHYEQYGIFEMNDLFKAKDTSKLVKKQITDKAGRRTTVYVKSLDDKVKKTTSWLKNFAGFFGIKSQKEAMKKVEKDYKDSNVAEKYSLTW